MSPNKSWNTKIMESDEGTLTRYLGVHFTRDAMGDGLLTAHHTLEY
jgi:hypothetical protein